MSTYTAPSNFSEPVFSSTSRRRISLLTLVYCALAALTAYCQSTSAEQTQSNGYPQFDSLLAVTLPLTKMYMTRGRSSEQPSTVLSSQQQSGTEDDWDTYIELRPDGKRFVANFKYRFPLEQDKSLIAAIFIKANTLGSDSTFQKRKLQIRNFSAKKWTTISNNTGSRDWRWQQHRDVLSNKPKDYISNRGVIWVRYRSNNAHDVSNIDFLQISTVSQKAKGEVIIEPSPWWQPTPAEKLTWQWQINGALDTSIDANMYDVDLFDTSVAQIANLKADGKTVVCYFSAGTYEGWRPDWPQFFPFISNESYAGDTPPFANKMADWDERWLDIRHIELLAPIMRSRLRLAAKKGCDAVEPDNVDAYSNPSETKLDLTYADQLAYNRWLANEAHTLGLSVGLKNDVEQLTDLVASFDFAINEQCFRYDECEEYAVFTSQNKAVFGVEYSGDPSEFCPQANSMLMSWLKKKKSLTSWRQDCSAF